MAKSLKHWEDDNTLYLFTSLTAGSSHILTATNRIETILLNARIPFTHIDTATDESAKRLFQRRGKGKKLPFLVKEGFVLGTLEEVEEWNEYGELKEMIGEVGTGHERSVETAPASKTMKPVDYSRELGIMPSIENMLNGSDKKQDENAKPESTVTPAPQQNNFMKSLAEEVASAAKSRGPIDLKSIGNQKETGPAGAKAVPVLDKEDAALAEEKQAKPSSANVVPTDDLEQTEPSNKNLEAPSEEDTTEPPEASKSESTILTAPTIEQEHAIEKTEVETQQEPDHAKPADVQEHLPIVHGSEDPDVEIPATTTKLEGVDVVVESKSEQPVSVGDLEESSHTQPADLGEGVPTAKGGEDSDLSVSKPTEAEPINRTNIGAEPKADAEDGIADRKEAPNEDQTSAAEQIREAAEPAAEKVEAVATAAKDGAVDTGLSLEAQISPVVQEAKSQASEMIAKAEEVARPIMGQASAALDSTESAASDAVDKAAATIPSTAEAKESVTGLGVTFQESATQAKEQISETAKMMEETIARPSTPPPTLDTKVPEPKTPEPQTPVKEAKTPSKLNPVTPQVAPSKQFKMEKKERKPEDGSPKPIHDQFMHFFF